MALLNAAKLSSPFLPLVCHTLPVPLPSTPRTPNTHFSTGGSSFQLTSHRGRGLGRATAPLSQLPRRSRQQSRTPPAILAPRQPAVRAGVTVGSVATGGGGGRVGARAAMRAVGGGRPCHRPRMPIPLTATSAAAATTATIPMAAAVATAATPSPPHFPPVTAAAAATSSLHLSPPPPGRLHALVGLAGGTTQTGPPSGIDGRPQAETTGSLPRLFAVRPHEEPWERCWVPANHVVTAAVAGVATC